MKVEAAIGTFIGLFLLAVLLGLLLSFPVMLLWNYCLVPAVVGINEIGWLQAWGIMLLSSLLFKTLVSNK